MWNTFGPDVLVAIIGAAVGAVLTVAVALFTFLASRRYRETQALNALVDQLHHRRAFAPISALQLVPDAATNPDFVRANASILSVKEEIRRTRESVRPVKALQEPLSRMTSACNLYLELGAYDPTQYWYLLTDLTLSMREEIEALGRAKRGIHAKDPGGAAFQN